MKFILSIVFAALFSGSAFAGPVLSCPANEVSVGFPTTLGQGGFPNYTACMSACGSAVAAATVNCSNWANGYPTSSVSTPCACYQGPANGAWGYIGITVQCCAKVTSPIPNPVPSESEDF